MKHTLVILSLLSLLLSICFSDMSWSDDNYQNDFYPMVELNWGHAGDGFYLVVVKVTRDNSKIYQYQAGPINRSYYRIDVDPKGLHEVSIISAGVVVYFAEFKHRDLPGYNEKLRF